jgi:hypothetical protein
MAMTPTPDKPPQPQGSTPVPDPTTLTTLQMTTAVEAVKDLLRAEIHGLTTLTDDRFNGLEKASVLLQRIFDMQPALTDAKIVHLQTLHAERFDSIQTQFLERDTRTEQTSRDSKVAVDAALQAAKEAVGKQQEASDRAIAKSDLSFTKQIDQIGTLIGQNNKSQDDKITDLKDRLTLIEGQNLGQRTSTVAQHNSNSATVAMIGLVVGSLIGIAGLVVGLVSHFTK